MGSIGLFIKRTLLEFETSVRFISGFGHTLGSLEKDSFEISEISKKQGQQKSIFNTFPVTDDIWDHGINNPLPQQRFLSVEGKDLKQKTTLEELSTAKEL